jgi:cytochrome c2
MRQLNMKKKSKERYVMTVKPAVVLGIGLLALGAAGPSYAQESAASRAQVERGEAWFYQRCSLCHMGRIVKDNTYEPMTAPLTGVLEDTSPAREQFVRAYIQQGSAMMPGFRYSFSEQEFEELMAYLKTL